MGFSLAAPSFDIQAATSEVCGEEKYQAGVSLNVGVEVAINAYEVAKAEFLGKEMKAEGKQTIYSTTTLVCSTCLTTPTAKRIM